MFSSSSKKSKPPSSTSKPKKVKWSVGDDLVCPITHELLLDPVIAEDGLMYERQAIQMHFRINQHEGQFTSPLTRETMGSRLFAAPQIKNHIDGLVEKGYIRGPEAVKWKQRKQEKKDQAKLIQKAQDGNEDAMLKLASNYYNGDDGFDENNDQAFHWFDAARDAGNIIGQCEAGNMLALGLGVEQNVERGILHLGTAAGRGSRVAAYYLGFALAEGRYGLPVHKKDAICWLKKCLSEKVSCPGDHGITEVGKRKARQQLDQLQDRDRDSYRDVVVVNLTDQMDG